MPYACSTFTAVLLAIALPVAGCTQASTDRSNEQEGKVANRGAMIDEATAREIAEKDALRAYRDLSIYRIKTELREGNWYVDYELEGEAVAGGGPHYVISATTGEIINRRYEQ
jgi:hypothetical protein